MADARRPNRIDVHHHFYPPEYLAVMGDAAKRRVVRDWTGARGLEEMDKNDIGAAVLSLSPPGLHHLGVEQMRRLARTVNEHAATLRATHRARYGHFASVPMPDVDGTLVEIAYALDKLGAEGIQLMTSYGERYPGHPDFAPVMDELNRRKALVFVHPLAPVCCAPSLAWIQPALFEFTQDTNRCVFSLLLTGTLARFPKIRFIFCHSGAAVPVLAGPLQCWDSIVSLPIRCRTALITSCASSTTMWRSRRTGRRLLRSLPTSQHRRFCSAATIRSARRPTAFVASRNMG
jgi:6-methylsalicylate decarboxylase